ncbi:MAG: hypothetical protein DMG13_02160 [Acidobacteria bacterium]|nr:MAG: hypothetical protein DMG13_02160 [Acidobacteriota bacterium]
MGGSTTTVEVPPQGRISRLVQEFLPEAPSDLMGSLRITSTIPVGGLCPTEENALTVGAVYDRPFFLDSTKYGRS